MLAGRIILCWLHSRGTSNLTAARYPIMNSSLLKTMLLTSHWPLKIGTDPTRLAPCLPLQPHLSPLCPLHHSRCTMFHSVPPALTPLLLSVVFGSTYHLPLPQNSSEVSLSKGRLSTPSLPSLPTPPAHTYTQTRGQHGFSRHTSP